VVLTFDYGRDPHLVTLTIKTEQPWQ